MRRRNFLSAAFAGLACAAAAILPGRASAAKREDGPPSGPLAHCYRKDADGFYREVAILDLKAGDRIISVGVRDGRLFMLMFVEVDNGPDGRPTMIHRDDNTPGAYVKQEKVFISGDDDHIFMDEFPPKE